MTTPTKPLTQHQLKLLLYLESHSLSTTREVAEGLGIPRDSAYHRLISLLVYGYVGRQPPLRRGVSPMTEPDRWQAVAR